ncbi:hypothetical protein SBX64_19505 [Vibrio rhizosphaerae]|uniref:Tetratricopeptide repeat protein n=1 Tax=Vibrio rhizosphaerae TaxID=398736 RepID=A0ABU4IZ94_9VIBR|nr:hypothetical protein [Vibrio rhizosphaerae]MDW6094734.1 hypothetical protein [Vibrio rhizosphaerae]
MNRILFIILCFFSSYIYANVLYNELIKDDRYTSFDIYLNDDLIVDKVITNKPYEGDEIYLFINKNKDHLLSFKGSNLSKDGETILDNIVQSDLERKNKLFSIILKSDNENYKEKHHIKYIQGTWYIESTDYFINNNLDDYTKTFYCHIKQNIELKLYNRMHSVPNSDDYDKKCTIIYYMEPSLSEFKSRFNDSNSAVYLGVDRYKYLFSKVPLNDDSVAQYDYITSMLLKNKAYKEAIYVSNHIVNVYPSKIVTYKNMGDAYWALKETSKAKDVYQTYIKLMKKDGQESEIPEKVLERAAL